MANEVEIVITSRNKARPAVIEAKKDAEGLGKAYRDVGRTATSALGQVRDALTRGLHDAVADVHGETNRMARAWRAVSDGAASAMDRARSVVRERLADVASDVVKRGREIGGKLVDGVVANVKASATRIKGTLHDAFTGGIKGVLSTPVLGPIIIGALTAAVALAAPAIGAAIGGSLILGIGAGLTGVGALLLFQNEKIKAEFSASWKEIQKIMTDAAQPVLPVLRTVMDVAKDTVKVLAPVIETALKAAQGPMKDFVRNLGEGFENLAPSIGPLMDAFSQILNTLGPQLPGIFTSISDSLINLANVAIENKDLIAGVFVALLNTLPLVINLVAGLTSGFRGVFSFLLGGFETFLGVMANVVEVIGHIPGMEEWAAGVSASLRSAQEDVQGFKNQLDNFPKIVKLEGDIRDLDTKIAIARNELNDPDLTRERRAELKAEIAQLLAAKRQAQNAINSLRGKTVYLTTVNQQRTVTNYRPYHGTYATAHGGIIGGRTNEAKAYATGGITSGSTALVGEEGPELVKLPFGSTVVPAGQTRAMMSNPATSGFNSVSMAFRAAGGSSGGSGIASGLRDVATALREIITLRDGFDRLTGSVFGQVRAVSAYEAAWDAAKRSLKDNGKRLSLTTEKGRENRAALIDLAEAAQGVVIAMREQGHSITTVSKKMAEQRAEFIKLARSFGLSSKEAKALADRYGLLPSKVKSILTTEAKDLAFNKKISASGKATGGIAGGWTLTGERGPELVRLPYGSSVVPHGQTAAMLSGGAGGGPTVIEIRSGGSRLDDLLVEILRRAVRTRGGNVQLVLGRS